jgi:hypothetical protein
MRTFAILGAAFIAAVFAGANGARAWTQEQPAQQQQGVNAADLSDPDNFKALEDKVNGKTQSSTGTFQIYGGVNGGAAGGLTHANPYGLAPMGGSGSAFSYSPNPGFRGNSE